MTKQHQPPPSPFSTWTYPPDLPPNIPLSMCFSAPFLPHSLPPCLQSCKCPLFDTIKSSPLPFPFPPAIHLTAPSTPYSMTFLPSSCSLPLSLLKPAPPLMAVICHCPHLDTSFHAIHKNYLWSLSAIRVTATFPYLLMQHVTPSLSLFHGNVLRILTDLSSFFLFPSTDILPSLSAPTSLHLPAHAHAIAGQSQSC